MSPPIAVAAFFRKFYLKKEDSEIGPALVAKMRQGADHDERSSGNQGLFRRQENCHWRTIALVAYTRFRTSGGYRPWLCIPMCAPWVGRIERDLKT